MFECFSLQAVENETCIVSETSFYKKMNVYVPDETNSPNSQLLVGFEQQIILSIKLQTFPSESSPNFGAPSIHKSI